MTGGLTNSLKRYVTVSEAARLLGVSASTLRNWDRQGKVVASRHPVNGYRLYKRQQLAALLSSIGGTTDDDHVNSNDRKDGTRTQGRGLKKQKAGTKHA